MTMPATVLGFSIRLFFIALLCLCPLHLPHSKTTTTHTYCALGLVNVPPIIISRPTSTWPWAVRSHNGRIRTSLSNAPEGTTTDGTLTTAPPLPSDATRELATAEVEKFSPNNKAATPQSPNSSRKGTNNIQNAPLRDGAWVPPSQNVAQRRHGRIFSIQKPDDLLDFVIEDERLSVVKVYASWCKTCQVFDVRYRKLASQLGDKYDNAKSGSGGTEITKMGRVRFAEMQYDNLNNEEMCKLLNATKLPYIFMYKGSQGKMEEFQCGPAKFQMLVDAVNKYADPAAEEDVVDGVVGEINQELEKSHALNEDNSAASPPPAQPMPSYGEDTIDSLKQQLVTLENEKIEMFEIMKAQIEHDKVYIKKLENGVETQRSMLEAKDGEIASITTKIEQQQSMLQSKEEEIQTLRNNLQHQREENKQAKNKITVYESQVTQLTDEVSKIENTITSVEQTSSLHEKSAQKNESELIRQIEEWKEEKKMYEEERNSLRKLTSLGIKRVGRGVRSLVSRVRRK
mmetsp:Transcript_34629/g.74885  ORF Transcript_34629/g.74885 Transcript_34629/m.74885 type:complete len:514 (+) Transcript_34629:40-1581(+)